MARYSVHEVKTRTELDQVVEVVIKAFNNPYLPSATILFPVFGYTEEARVASVAEAKERFWKQYQSNQFIKWIFVREDTTGHTVRGAQWEWCQGSLSEDGIVRPDCAWWPDVEAKKFCDEMLRQAFTPRCIWMREPHASRSNYF